MNTESSETNQPKRTVAILNPIVPMPEFTFFQLVKVKTTKEVGTVIGMWCVQTEAQTYQWLYRLDGLTERSALWWQELQLRSLDRRQR